MPLRSERTVELSTSLVPRRSGGPGIDPQDPAGEPGTIDDSTAIIDRPALSTRGTVSYPPGTLPYWATTSADGRYCLVSLNNANAVSVVDYTTALEVARIPVGTFPQRERLGRISGTVLASLS